jgi:hypothetical protein
MKIVSIYRTAPQHFESGPAPELHERMGKLIGALLASGELIDTGGIIPDGMLTRIRINGDNTFSVTDGPFTESKELVGGFAVFDVPSRERALQLSERFLSLTGSGECELIEVSALDG